MKTFKQIRDSFWNNYPEFKEERRSNKSQNDYKTDIRCAFNEYTWYLRQNNIITESIYNRITLK
jgi:hypothetical protein